MDIINKVINSDCLAGLKDLPENSVDAVITSPPYLLGKEYNEGGDINAENPYTEWIKYSDWLVEVLKECVRVLKPSGKLMINIDDRHTGLKSYGKNIVFPTHSKITMELSTIIDYKEMILWKKIRAAPTSGGSLRLLGSYGTLGSPGEIPIVQEVEYILIFRKDGKRTDITDELRIDSALSPEEFGEYGMQIWEVEPERNRVHPAPFPTEIPKRLIKLFTFKNDLILDPFGGSGTTAIAALECGRNYLLYELEKNFCDMTELRIESFIKNGQDKTYLKTNSIHKNRKKEKINTSNIF